MIIAKIAMDESLFFMNICRLKYLLVVYKSGGVKTKMKLLIYNENIK